MILNRKEMEAHCSYFPQYIDCVIVILLTVDVNFFFESNNLGGAVSTCKREEEFWDVLLLGCRTCCQFFYLCLRRCSVSDWQRCRLFDLDRGRCHRFSWSCMPIFQVDQTVQCDFARVWLWRRHGRTVVETCGGQGYWERSRFPDCGMMSWWCKVRFRVES